MKNRGLKVDINHVSIPLGGKLASNNSANNIADNFPDSSIGEGMDITIQGANGHVKHNTDNQSLKSYDSKTGNGGQPPPPSQRGEEQQTQSQATTEPLQPPRSNGNGGICTGNGGGDNEKRQKYSDISIGLGMDISIRGDGDANGTKEAAASAPDMENGWGVSRHSSLQFESDKMHGGDNGGDEVKREGSLNEVDEDQASVLSQTEIKHVQEVLIDPVDDIVVEDCCWEVCYRVCPCCIGDADSPFWQLWYRHRLQVSRCLFLTYQLWFFFSFCMFSCLKVGIQLFA